MRRLTQEQVLAAAELAPLVNIVSEPGSGKTTVAAERFGYELHSERAREGVLGLSFNRAAADELANRIRRRWGARALTFPDRVTTLDQLHVDLLEALLAAGLVRWPSSVLKLDVRDSYAGLPGYQWLRDGGWRRQASLAADYHVHSVGVRVDRPQFGIGRVAPHRSLLDDGIVSHEDVRQVLSEALARESPQEYAGTWFRENFRSIVVDEIYDAARLDLLVLAIAANAGLRLTVVGDPWQALYGWRGATPELVARLVEAPEVDFVAHTLSHSFRFRGDQMPLLAASLRRGEGVRLPTVQPSDVDVVLARNWAPLWRAGEGVLPVAFRTISNRTDAALTLLLDLITRSRLQRPAFGRREAITMLGLSLEQVDREQVSVLQPVVDLIRRGSSPAEGLDALRRATAAWAGIPAIRHLGDAAETRVLGDVRQVGLRLSATTLIPGLTVFQAKGQEWPCVGVALTVQQTARLAHGLEALGDEDCVLYVALTRAICQVGQVSLSQITSGTDDDS